MDPRFVKILRPIATVTVFVFTWISFEPWNYALWFQSPRSAHAAPAPSPKPKSSAGQFEANLRGVQKLIQAIDNDLTENKDLAPTLQRLRGHQKALEEADIKIRKEFSETEAFLKKKNLPQVILDRHTKAVSDYDGNYKKLKRDLEGIFTLDSDRQLARKKKDDLASARKQDNLKKHIQSLKDDLETKVKKPRHQPLDPNNLPHRAAKPTERKPRLKKEEFTEFLPENKPVPVAYNGEKPDFQFASHTPGADLPTPEDLAETIEVQFTIEINELASSLDHNPVKIYNWVHNNIDFTPTWGSIQGANHCLLTKQCNAFDTSSLLIALLRTSGVPARYVMGTIEVPIDQFMNWVGGFTDANAALTFAASGGIPTTGLQQGGTIKAARLEHVWAEGYVDYVPSRGAVNKEGDTWVPMDGGFKQFILQNGIDLDDAIVFDASSFISALEASADINESVPYIADLAPDLIEGAVNDLVGQLTSYVDQNNPSVNGSLLLGTRTILPTYYKVNQRTLPYNVVARASAVSEILNVHRFKAIINVTDGLTNFTEMSIERYLPELSGDKITLSYAPASSFDEALLLSLLESGGDDLPAYLIELRPELRIENLLISSGNSVVMGNPQSLKISISSQNTSDIISSTGIIAGTYSGIVLDVNRIVPQELSRAAMTAESTKDLIEAGNIEGITKDQYMGQFLYGMGLSYWGLADLYNDINARQNNVVDIRLPSIGVFSYDLDIQFGFGVPLSAEPYGFKTDIDADTHAISSMEGDKSKEVGFFTQTGLINSHLEGSIYDISLNEAYSGDSISTAHIFKLINQGGIPLHIINESNVNAVTLNLPTEVITDVQSAASAGLVVLIPNELTTIGKWTGTGYIIYDKSSGSSGYIISGGLSGGGYECTCFKLTPAEELIVGGLIIGLGLHEKTQVAAAIVAVAAFALSLWSTICQINHKENLDADEKLILIFTSAIFAGVGVIQAFKSVGEDPDTEGADLALGFYYLFYAVVVNQVILGTADTINRIKEPQG